MENEIKVIYVDKKAIRKARFKRWVRKTSNTVGDWIYRNRETIAILGPTAIGATTTITKAVNKRVKLKNEKRERDFQIYDRSQGHYWTLRRKLNNREWETIAARKKNGERLADILSDLKVLK